MSSATINQRENWSNWVLFSVLVLSYKTVPGTSFLVLRCSRFATDRPKRSPLCFSFLRRRTKNEERGTHRGPRTENYFFGLGHLATTSVPIPPLGRNCPLTSHQTGFAAFTTSSSIWFTTFS